MSKIPSYRKVYQTIKSRISGGIYRAGTLLPTESELEQEFGVSRTTIRRATNLLTSGGYLRPCQGRGTEVLDYSTSQRLNRITSVTESLLARGFSITTEGMCIERVPAPEQTAEALHLRAGAEVFRLQRVQYADGNPIALMENYLRTNLVPDFDQHTGAFISLYSFLEQEYQLIFTSSTDCISATCADFILSQVLHVPLGSPLLVDQRTTYTEQGPLEFGTTHLVAEQYKYVVHLEGRE